MVENLVVPFCRLAGIGLPNSPKSLVFQALREADRVYVILDPARQDRVLLRPFFLKRRKAMVVVEQVPCAGNLTTLRARGEGLREVLPEHPVSLGELALEMYAKHYPTGVVDLFEHLAGVAEIFRFIGMKDVAMA